MFDLVAHGGYLLSGPVVLVQQQPLLGGRVSHTQDVEVGGGEVAVPVGEPVRVRLADVLAVSHDLSLGKRGGLPMPANICLFKIFKDLEAIGKPSKINDANVALF